jgi:hypothetical protein
MPMPSEPWHRDRFAGFLFDKQRKAHSPQLNKMSTTYTAKASVPKPTLVKMAVPAFSDVAKPANDVSYHSEIACLP